MTQHHFIDRVGRESRLGQQRTDHHRAELGGGDLRERALEGADGGASGGDDDDFGHDRLASNQNFISGTEAGTIRRPAVFALISSTLTPGARSLRWNAPSAISM